MQAKGQAFINGKFSGIRYKVFFLAYTNVICKRKETIMENKYDMPIGLSFQLGLNEKALSVYAQMDEEEKRQVVEAARNVTSKVEMQQLVSELEHNFV